MARTRGEPPRRHAGPLPMECDYGKKLNGRRPADSPRLPSYNEPETSATERQRGGKHAYTQEKPARNAPETRVCRAMNAMESLSRPRHAALARGKVDSPCSPSMLMSWRPPARAPAPADRTPWARSPALANQTPLERSPALADQTTPASAPADQTPPTPPQAQALERNVAELGKLKLRVVIVRPVHVPGAREQQ